MDRLDAERDLPSGRSVVEPAIEAANEVTDPVGYRADLEAIRDDHEREALDRYEVAASGRSFERYTAPVRDGDGAPLGRLFVLREVTAEDRASRATDEFVALASHELRTPLTSILGYLEIVMDEEVGPICPDQRRFLGIIERNAHRLLRLVGDLLVIARGDAGRLGMEIAEVDLGDLAYESVVSARPIAEVQGIDLAIETESLPVLGDRSRLGAVLDNLVSNALKFTPPGGRVTVRAYAGGGGAVVEVRDTGMGIPADEQDRLFQRFYRTPAAEAAAIPGTGLGLAISRMTVDAHGGSIGMRSEEGRGSTFLVWLPLAIDAGGGGREERPLVPTGARGAGQPGGD
jgi:signal transduction histidine kinase